MTRTANSRRWALRLGALVAVLALALAACGGGDDEKGDGGGGGDEGKPVAGGTVTYAVEGATTNFCIPRAQLAISGILVVEAVYDTLTRPTQDPNVYEPYLAKSVTPNDDYTQWTIEVRDGVTFHDGTPLTAEVVKQNLDVWRNGVLLNFVFQNIADTVVSGNTVVVTTKVPWVAFPAFLWSTGRTGIAAPSQLDSPDCDTKMVGTGPFKVDTFDPTTGNVSTSKNESYWREGYPYLDGIDFIVQEESSQRFNGLEGGQFDITHSSGGKDLSTAQAIAGTTTQLEPKGRQEISHMLINVSRPPLNNVDARKAVAMAVDRDKLNLIDQKGMARYANQVFDTRITGYVEDPGFPKHDVAEAKKLVEKVKAANGGQFAFTIATTFDQSTQTLFKEVKRQLAQVGIEVTLAAPVDQATIINQAIGGSVDAFGWRNYPGQDPDTLYVWFYGGSIVNFNHIDDPVIDEALNTGRSDPDPDERKQAYETFNRRMSEQVYNMWTWYTQWFVAHSDSVHGITGPNLPDDTGAVGTEKPVDILAGYHQMLGIWSSK
ncbi:MAG: ABC transporter substrate-binding protein [Actinobacteria bacterium]|nr:ABC transporter substrate-binding protein [Actinomycetota bacterium]